MSSARVVPALLVVLFSFRLVSGGEPSSPSPKNERLRLIFITTCVDEDFFLPVKKGMADAAKLMDVECKFTGTHGVDVKAQAQMVRHAVDGGYDGIALNIIHDEAFDGVVAEAIEKGVPVVGFNVDDHLTPNARLASVNQQVYDAGRTLAQRALDFVPPGSHILMTLHDEGVSSLDDRLRGEQEVLKKKNVTWTVVVTGRHPEPASRIVSKALKADPRIRFVLCTGQADTEGTGLAIERDFAGKGYAAAGFDLSPNILRLIKAGHIRFTIDQQPYTQGFYPVVQLALYCRYGLVPSTMDAGAGIIDGSNVERVIELNRLHLR
jgi:simple sugar transport system substrate-binding protein